MKSGMFQREGAIRWQDWSCDSYHWYLMLALPRSRGKLQLRPASPDPGWLWAPKASDPGGTLVEVESGSREIRL